MSSKNSADAILDEISKNLGVDKRKPGKGKSNSKASASSMARRTTPTLACEPSTSFASSGSATQSLDPAATETESEISKLQSTVKGLADQMAWFMQKLAEDEAEPETAAELDVVDATDMPQAPNAQTWSIDEAEPETDCSEMLSGLELYYGADDVVAAEIDPQLAGIVANLVTKRLPEEKMKEKAAKYARPGNCACLSATRVNPEIWDKLSAPSRSRDARSQRGQQSTMQAMIAITSATDNLVRASRANEALNKSKMAATITSLVDALAFLGNANQETNQRRRDDQKAELSDAFKSLSKADPDESGLLYGTDLTAKIRDISEANRLTSRLTATATGARASFRERGAATSRHQPYAGSRPTWMGRFRGAFLEQDSRPSYRGKSLPRRGQRPRARQLPLNNQHGREAAS